MVSLFAVRIRSSSGAAAVHIVGERRHCFQIPDCLPNLATTSKMYPYAFQPFLHLMELGMLSLQLELLLDGVTHVNKVCTSLLFFLSLFWFHLSLATIVRFGLIPSNFKESTGDTIGGFGSTIALKRGSFKASRRKFMGTIVARPDIKNSLCTTSSILFLFKSIIQKERRVCLLFVL